VREILDGLKAGEGEGVGGYGEGYGEGKGGGSQRGVDVHYVQKV